MATVKSTSTTFTREYSLDDGSDDKAAIKLRLSVPFDLVPERAKEILDDMVQALEIERDAYLEKRGLGRQTSFIPRGPLTEMARSGKARMYAGGADNDGGGD
jgi:hypothetical protein